MNPGGQPRTTRVQVERISDIGRGRIKVKIQQTDINMTGLNHNGKIYIATKNLGRGRYIMRQEGANG